MCNGPRPALGAGHLADEKEGFMNDELLLEQLEKHNSFYLYDEEGIANAAQQLKTDFPGVEFLYSIKANPAGRVLDALFAQGFGADASSLNEVLYAQERGVPKRRIYYSAPGKTRTGLRRAVGRCVVIADSFHELTMLEDVARELNEPLSVGLRLNPAFTFAGDGGVPGKFGVDEEEFFACINWLRTLDNVLINGIHVHAKSQELNPAALAGYYRRMFGLADRVETALGYPLDFANFGSGLGICWSEQDLPVDTAALGEVFSDLLAEYRIGHPKTKIYIETGRFVTGQNGIYVTKVIDKKVSRGKTFVLLYDTLNGFARPCLSRMIAGIDKTAAPCEPLYAGADTYTLRILNPRPETETVTLAGNLCTAADIVAQDIPLPRLEIGDGVVFSNAGCYSAVMTPMQFASLIPPAQLFLTAEGEVLET